jgi:hypothetical protein
MKIAIQDTFIAYDDLDKTFQALNEIQPDAYNTFGVIPFTKTINFTNPVEEPTILFGGTKMVKLWLEGYVPTQCIVYYDKERFDQAYYNEFLNDHLLNKNAKFTTWGHIKNMRCLVPTFIKPSTDLKYFSGFVCYNPENTVEAEVQANQFTDADLSSDVSIMYNNVIDFKIKSEYRVFVVNNRICDMSQYMLNGKVTHEAVKDEELRNRITEYVHTVRSIYQPHYNYVIDVYIDEYDRMGVVEFNCIHCSGMYSIDRKLLFSEILKSQSIPILTDITSVEHDIVEFVQGGDFQKRIPAKRYSNGKWELPDWLEETIDTDLLEQSYLYQLKCEDIYKQLLPNPFTVDYQHPKGPLDLYTEEEMIKYAKRIILECVETLREESYALCMPDMADWINDTINQRFDIGNI